MLKKKQRAYNCILFQTHYDYYICVPYSKKHRSGLDYTKIVIINKSEYVDRADALVDKDEYNETVESIKRIKREALKFVDDYVNHVKDTQKLSLQEFKRRYSFSTLQYFHNELGIPENGV